MVEIVRGQGPRWRVRSVRKLSPEENRGKHNVYVDVWRNGSCIRSLSAIAVCYGWQDAPAQTVRLDKPMSEPGTNFPIYLGANYWAKVADVDGNQSETVTGLTCDLPDEPMPADGMGGNTNGHHSWMVEFEWTAEEKPQTNGLLSEVYACLDQLVAALAKIEKRV